MRYEFVILERTVAMGDNTAWRNMRIEVIPFVRVGEGRLFDHNRVSGHYELTAYSSRITDDATRR